MSQIITDNLQMILKRTAPLLMPHLKGQDLTENNVKQAYIKARIKASNNGIKQMLKYLKSTKA